MLSFEFGFLCIFLVAVFSARALGAGFRHGVRSTVSTALTKGRTGRRFFAASPERFTWFLYLSLPPSASAVNRIKTDIKKKKKKKNKKMPRSWYTNHLHYTSSD